MGITKLGPFRTIHGGRELLQICPSAVSIEPENYAE